MYDGEDKDTKESLVEFFSHCLYHNPKKLNILLEKNDNAMQGPQKYPMNVEKFANDAEAALRMEIWTQ